MPEPATSPTAFAAALRSVADPNQRAVIERRLGPDDTCIGIRMRDLFAVAKSAQSMPLQDRIGSAIITLPSDSSIQIERSVAASTVAVFEAWTTPALIRRWWGSPTHPLTMCEVDLRVGGGWHYAMTVDDIDYHWRGTYQEIDAPKRLVSTELMDGDPPAQAVNTLTLVERDGATAITIVIQHQDRASRDAHIASGMGAGMNQTLDRLDALVSRAAGTSTADVHREPSSARPANPSTPDANQ